MSKIDLSIIVIFHNMRREALRTLYTLTTTYQLDSASINYEVIAVDNGSSLPLNPEEVRSFGPQFKYVKFNESKISPCAAINKAVQDCNGDVVTICIDGARMLTPRILSLTSKAMSLYEDGFVYTLSLHLGSKPQGQSMLEGYNQEQEDRMLLSVDWFNNGYNLFKIASLAGSSSGGYFSPVNESNNFSLKRGKFLEMGGFDERFIYPGGGLANLDFFERVQNDNSMQPIMLLGEATFHQFHGGVASNAPVFDHPWNKMIEEYRKIHGRNYNPTYRSPIFWGFLEKEAKTFINKYFSI